jgi:hypothetical protein
VQRYGFYLNLQIKAGLFFIRNALIYIIG